MPNETGIWTVEEALEHHDFSYKLAKWIGDYFSKEDVIIDWGCGRGTYLRYLHDRGFENLHGVEGTDCVFEFGNIAVQDLTKVAIVKDPIGNSICLEVGEHIPKEYEKIFIDNLCNNTLGKIVLSWAIPGQDGIGHVNCQHNVYIIEEMRKRGFRLLLADTLYSRQHVENRLSYFRDTLMIFERYE